MGGRFAGQALSGMMLPAAAALIMKPELFGVNPNLLGRKPKPSASLPGGMGTFPKMFSTATLPGGMVTSPRMSTSAYLPGGMGTVPQIGNAMSLANSIYGGVI